jgi:hypothetical protein
MPMPVSVTTNTSCPPSQRGRQRDAAGFGELDGIAQQVQQHLAQAQGSPMHAAATGSLVQPQLQTLGAGTVGDELERVSQHTRRGPLRVASICSLPASILEKSRISLTTPSSWLPEARIFSKALRALSGRGNGCAGRSGQSRARRSWACGSRGSCWPGIRCARGPGSRPPPAPARAPHRRTLGADVDHADHRADERTLLDMGWLASATGTGCHRHASRSDVVVAP